MPQPQHPQQAFQQAVALYQGGRLDRAAQLYEAVLKADRNHFASLHNLGVIRFQQQRLDEAAGLLRRALLQNPRSVDALSNLGNALLRLGRVEEAVGRYERALALDPDRSQVLSNLGVALVALNRHADAVVRLERALVLDPNDRVVRSNLAKSLLKIGRYGTALRHFDKILALDPGDHEAHTGRGQALDRFGRHDEARQAYRCAIALKPDHALAHHDLGVSLATDGRIDEARRAFEQAVALEPRTGRYHRALADTKRFAPGDPHLAAMEELARDLGSLSEDDQLELHFALAKALDDVGRRDAAFRHLLKGNDLKRRSIHYDEATTLARLAGVQAANTASFLRDRAGLGNPSPKPVFIVGMPRSGTTLVEQILASHPAVFGAGERDDFTVLVDRNVPGFADPLPAVTDVVLQRMAADYIAAVSRDAAPGAARITDKMPANFVHLGLIHLALPNARIIHIRRQPIDTCLSIFSKLFTVGQPFAYDLGELGRYYKAYERLMEHWRQVLPPGVMLEVEYEEVVADLERQARRMIAHCGLEWNQACLAFHNTERPVLTASMSQVRQPIYTSSVGRWRAYGAMLDPLLEALGMDRSAAPALPPALPTDALTGWRVERDNARRGGEMPNRPADRTSVRSGAQVGSAKVGEKVATLVRLHADSQGPGQSAAMKRGDAQSGPQRPRQPPQIFRQAVALHQGGHFDEAAQLFEAVLKLDRNHFDALHHLAAIRARQERYEEATRLLRRALLQNPRSADAHNTLGNVLQKLGRVTEAVERYERALALDPKQTVLHNNLGFALLALHRDEEAVPHLEQALLRTPDDSRARYELGKALLKIGRYEAGLAQFEKALAVSPDDFEVLASKGNALDWLGRREEARHAYRRAIELKPDHAVAHHDLAIAFESDGRLVEARQAFERAVALEPRRGRFHRTLADTKRFTPDDPHLGAMEELARDIDSLPEDDRMELHFALAKALDDIGRHEAAFRHLLAANALKRQSARYDEPAALAELAAITAAYTAALLRDEAALGDPSPVPVFVIGMPRSGTTLVEQILASHPAVFGAGERRDIGRLVDRDFSDLAGLAQAMTGATLQRMAADYLDAVGQDATPGAARIVDKMPANFLYAGVIHLALPNARIIHLRRDPVDTCFSIFSKLFMFGQAFAYDLGELGRYYRGYERLMEHWRRVLPPDVMLEVCYEDLVADLEGQARRMIAHCGLDWDEACLAFHKSERPVLTASKNQVRQPIYTRSVGRWRAYGALLDPLFEALGIDRSATSS